MKRLPIALAFVGVLCAPVSSQSTAVAAQNNVVMVDREPGTTADAKFSSCVREITSSGGYCNAIGFGGTTQMIAATVTTVPGVYLIMSPATIFQPSTARVDMFSIAENSGIEGLTVNANNISNYSGNAVKFVNSCLQSDHCYLRDFNLINGSNGTNPGTGTAILLEAANGANALSFVDIEHGRITGFQNGIYLTATGKIGGSNFVNDTRVSDVVVTNAVNCITIYAAPGDVYGNTFNQVTCEAGGGNIAGATGFVVKGQAGSNDKANLFINGNIWDYGNGSVKQTSYAFDANSSVNWLQANIPMGYKDDSSDAGTNNQIWNLGFPLRIKQAGINQLEIIPKTGDSNYWLATNGKGNEVCLSNGLTPGGNPVCVDAAGDLTTSGHLNQSAPENFAGTCRMTGGTTCTFQLHAAFSSPPICIATEQISSSPIAAGCAVSGRTVTITAASANSSAWGALIIGNPN